MVTPPGAKRRRCTPTSWRRPGSAGVDRVFRVGGAQAVAALAYGTESIPKVDKIVGPGNQPLWRRPSSRCLARWALT